MDHRLAGFWCFFQTYLRLAIAQKKRVGSSWHIVIGVADARQTCDWGKFGCFVCVEKDCGTEKIFSDVWKYRRLESSSMIYGRVHEKGSLVTCPPMKHSECKGQNGLPPNWLLSMRWRDCFIARHPTHPQVIYFFERCFRLVLLFSFFQQATIVHIYIYILVVFILHIVVFIYK